MLVFKISGSSLNAIAAKLRTLTSGRIASLLARKLAPVVQELSDRPWQRRASVNGAPWAARKHSYFHPILEKSGKMRRSVRSRAVGANVVTSTSAPYARFHHDGTRSFQPRPFFPVGQLPAVWVARINKTVTQEIERILRG